MGNFKIDSPRIRFGWSAKIVVLLRAEHLKEEQQQQQNQQRKRTNQALN